MGEVFQELYEWLGSEEGKKETVIVSVKQVGSSLYRLDCHLPRP